MEIKPETANRIVATLASVTAADITRGASILPLDLNAAIFVLDASIEYVANTETSHIIIFICYSSIAEMNPEILQDEFVNVCKQYINT